MCQPPKASTAFRGDGGGGAACFSRSSPSTNVSVSGRGAAAMVLGVRFRRGHRDARSLAYRVIECFPRVGAHAFRRRRAGLVGRREAPPLLRLLGDRAQRRGRPAGAPGDVVGVRVRVRVGFGRRARRGAGPERRGERPRGLADRRGLAGERERHRFSVFPRRFDASDVRASPLTAARRLFFAVS